MSRNQTMIIPNFVAEKATSDVVRDALARATRWSNYETRISLRELTSEVLSDLIRASNGVDKTFSRTLGAIEAGRKGNFKTIPRFDAAAPMMIEYLKHEMIDGWVYKRTDSGGLRAYLVKEVSVVEPRSNDTSPRLMIVGSYNSILGSERSRNGSALTATSWSLEPGEVTRKTPSAVMESLGVMKETEDLRQEYLQDVERYRDILTQGFAQQYRYSGTPMQEGRYNWSTNPRERAKVVHDVHPSEILAFTEKMALEIDAEIEVVRPVPLHFDLRVFDLATHTKLTVDSRGLEEYVYDKSLREKLVLPDDQRDLLDILTQDITTFTSDMIEGKSAGNAILCKGVPGVGKTLSAEIYAELTERPLYSIHSGSLGVTADAVRENLEKIFQRSQRWDAVLLLDEADVFVIERGDNLEQNAIVAEFLRTMEYFKGLLFMTTNRADSIDEAIVSRCAAIIDYRVPEREDARKIWHVLAALSETALEEDLVESLLDGFPEIAPRDIKMLLRLTLRVSLAKGEPLSVDTFRRCAMFRGLHFVG